jgi:hypothetical protein
MNTQQTADRIDEIRSLIAKLEPKAETGEQHAELCSLYAELETLGAL